MRVVGLLRGVNLGPSRSLKMAELRAAVAALGHTDVETYLQSGNVVFTPAVGAADGPAHLAAGITAALAEQVGMAVNVLVRTGPEMAAVVAANPYQREDPTKVVVVFLPDAAAGAPAGALDLRAFAPEGLTAIGTELYLDLPFGQARSPLLVALGKQQVFGAVATSRNWRTVQALAAMAAR
jgi:uncharacterized protein (DUF1697 family)